MSADICQQPFRDVIAWRETFGEMCDWNGAPLVTAGETYLENCLDPAKSPAEQPQSLETFCRLAQLIPPSPHWLLYTPTVQPKDLDRHGAEEILLHTQIYVEPGFPPCYDRKGRTSIVYDRDDERRDWRGTLIWPSYFGGIHHPEPDVRCWTCPALQTLPWCQS